MGFLTGISLKAWLYGAALLAIVAGAALFSHDRYTAGEVASDARWTARLQVERDEAQKALEAATLQVKKLTDDAAAATAVLSTNYVTKEDHEQAVDRARLDALRSGAQRLRVAVDPGACRAGAAPNDPAAAAGSNGQTTADLPGVVAARLESRADLADQIVREHTLLQDWAAIAVRTCNGPNAATGGSP